MATLKPTLPGSRPTSFEVAIEEACSRSERWYRTLPSFENRVNLGSVVGFKHPALVSEHDCVVQFARFLHEGGVPWDAMNHELSVSRWLFDGEHPAATAGVSKRWRVDLALRESETFRKAELPAKSTSGFQFDAFLEFAYLSDFWRQEKARRFGAPEVGRVKVANDVEKISRYLDSGACRTGYVIVFEECSWGFTRDSIMEMERNGCRVRFVRSYSQPCPVCASEAVVPLVWGLPGPDLERQAEAGELVLGGCLIEGGDLDPEWECQTCTHRWRSSPNSPSAETR